MTQVTDYVDVISLYAFLYCFLCFMRIQILWSHKSAASYNTVFLNRRAAARYRAVARGEFRPRQTT
jgi:hypothetical protein